MPEENNHQLSVSSHYRRRNLGREIFQALEKAGRKITSYKDALSFDQFHMRGPEATRELAGLAGILPDEHVLDLGCGIGGAARLLAAEFGCRVTGLDIMEEFIEAAAEVTRRTGLSGRVDFHAADMLDMPFEDNSFDVAWSQHTLMNIEEKKKLLARIHRVLRPGGRLALYEVAEGNGAPVYYPVQWASDASINFILSPERFREMILEAGYEELHWQEVSAQCSEWFENIVAKMKQRPAGAPPPLGVNLVIGPTAAEKARNTARNLKEGRIRVLYNIFRKK